LDLNVGLPKLDAPAVMAAAVRKVQEYSELPLQIDSSDPAAVEQGCRYYCGVPLINSVNGEEDVMARIFPIAEKYGAVVLGLAMDGNGVPKTAGERAKIAERIIRTAQKYGIPKHKIMIDTLVLTASAEQKLVTETVEALRLVRALGVKTALGVSNVSFGLPLRPLLNKTFLTMAMTCGLNMPILNPLDSEMTGAVRAYAVLCGEDENAENYIALYKDAIVSASAPVAAAGKAAQPQSAENLYDCVCKGLKNHAAQFCERELQTKDPLTVVDSVLIAALDEVGRQYDGGKLFLPQLVAAAEAAKIAFAIIGERLPKGGAGKGKVVLCTVKGDVHDIGKNIVKVVLESYGYEVIDLGKDTPVEKVVEAYRAHKPLAVGLSALMTTTVKSMEQTIAALRAIGCECPIFVGGAVLSAEVAKEINADYYTRDALEFVKTLESVAQKA
ncbi:MAG: cobalamin-dependent protein, partial [Clostridiales bacterium]|nr:cobalamin-dependent protein [Clostridiales bacterium]